MSNDTVLKICRMLEVAGQSNVVVGDLFHGGGFDSMQDTYELYKSYGYTHSEEGDDQNEMDLIRDLMALGVTAMKAKESYGGEGQGDEHWSVVEIEFGFTPEVVYIELSGWYASHYGSELQSVNEVFPHTVEKIEWRKCK